MVTSLLNIVLLQCILKKNTREIGEIFGVDKNCVRQWLDKIGVSRKPQGGANNCKLSDWEVRQIRFFDVFGQTHREQAKRLNVNIQTIQRVVKRETYKWVK